MSYDDFRTGLTYRDVYMMLWDCKYKRRHTVLGKWHQIKKEMWERYLACLDDIRATRRGRFRRVALTAIRRGRYGSI